MLNVVCIGVYWKSWLTTTCGSSPFFSSITISMPSRSLWSLMSWIEVMRPSLTSCAIDSIRLALLTW